MAIAPLNQLDIYRIVHDFDQDFFKTAEELPKDQVDRIFVIIQVERKLYSHHLPIIELIDEIMRLYLENSPSVVTLLMLYNTPAIVVLHPLPFGSHHINTASRSLLVQLNKTPADGKLASYLQLMTRIFKHHFKKLTPDEKLELMRRSHITPWEQRSTRQKLELLGKIQAPTLWGQAKLKLQLLSWKVQFAISWALENNIILRAVVDPFIATGFGLCVSIYATLFFSMRGIAVPAICTELFVKSITTLLYYYVFVLLLPSLTITCLGLALRIPILPESLQKKGAWVQLVSWKCFLIAFPFPFIEKGDGFRKCQDLKNLLLQSINEANITAEKNAFVNAHLPDLLNEWMQLVNTSDTNTGSLQMQQ
jgi:hypothetical protein